MERSLALELRSVISSNNFEKLHQLLSRMKWRHRCAIHLRFWEDHSISQIANLMSLSWQDTDNLIKEAIRELRTEIKKINSNSNASVAA